MFEQRFEAMLSQYRDSVFEKKRFTGLVKDFFPQDAKSVNLLLMAYNLGIAEDIDKATFINNTFAYRYVKQLIDNFGLSRINADWIVSVWCVCYGAHVLGKKCDIQLQKQGAGPAIKEDGNGSGKQYGDLFTYVNSANSTGLAVTGFKGDKRETIIFQNRFDNKPVVEISDEVFLGEQVKEAVFTEGITSIGKKAFMDCKELHQVVLPISMKEIGDNAFEGCQSLKSISLPMQLEQIGQEAFKSSGLKTLIIPRTVYWLGEGTLANCENVIQMDIPENIDKVPERMFEGCTSLKKVTLHDRLTAIGTRAFYGCSSLDYIIIPDSVTEIGDDAFDEVDKQFIIQCSFGSYAEQYCRKKRIKYQLV